LFGATELAELRKIRRLTTDLGVNLAGVEVILRLTDELASLRANLPRD
jgi:MerR family transcriptional regulator/heat shock protein HspR